MAEAEGQVSTPADPAERAQWRATALRLVRQYPDPVLRHAARPVEDVDGDVRDLLERMTRVMTGAHGVGLAGPQVGVLRRVLVYRGDDDEPRSLVNPVIEERSDETATDTEGCLSLLGGDLIVPVERPSAIRVTGVDGRGRGVDIDLEGLEARIVQHEVDHLDGVLILERTDPEARRTAMRELRLRAPM